MLVNDNAVWEAVKKHRIIANIQVFGSAGLGVVLLIFLAFRKPKKSMAPPKA